MDGGLAIAALRQCALFEPVADPELERVAGSLRRRSFRRGEVIFHAGDPGDSLHVIATGSVKIALESPDGDEAILVTLGPGAFFGELAVVDEAPRSATATAVEPSQTLTLSRVALRRLMDEDPRLRDALFAGVAGALRRLTLQLEELSFLDLRGRLAVRLARMARSADPSGGSVTMPWPYTQSDLAAMVGGTRQRVNRLLGDLADEGLIAIGAGTLTVRDVDALLRVGER